MNKLFLSVIFSAFVTNVIAQITEANTMPSVNEVYITTNGQMMGELSDALRATDMPDGWFDHRTDLTGKDIYSEVRYEQKEKGYGDNKKLVSYRSDSLIDAEADAAQVSVDESMKYWFTSASGEFPDVTRIAERAYENVSDAQFMIQNNTTNSRIDQTGFDLIQKTYVLVYHFDKVKYIEEEVENPITKVVSIKKSMKVNYTANAYRMEFDSLGGLEFFFMEYWDKPEAWKDFKYSLVKKMGSDEKPSLQSVTVSLDKAYNHGDAGQRQSALQKLAKSMRSSALESLTFGSDDFKVRTALSNIRPLEAAVGTKQRIKRHDRFFMYTILENEKGEEVLGKRKGVLRAKVVADNTGATTGEAQFTIFKQYGGSKPYPGIYLESDDDIGLYVEPSASVAIGSNNAFSSSYGLTFGYDFSDVRLGLDFGILPFAGVDPGWITLDNDLYLFPEDDGIGILLPGDDNLYPFDVTIDPSSQLPSEKSDDWRGSTVNVGLHLGIIWSYLLEEMYFCCHKLEVGFPI